MSGELDTVQASPAGTSEDAGERWYQLIQADSDLSLIALSLRDRASKLRALARGRKFTGPQCANARQMLRTEADQCILTARRAEEIGR
jgi:hypothetical protein